MIKQEWANGLSTRSFNALCGERISSKEEVIELMTGPNWGKCPNLGNKGIDEVCKWAGIPHPKQQKRVKDEEIAVKKAIDLLVSKGYIVSRKGEVLP